MHAAILSVLRAFSSLASRTHAKLEACVCAHGARQNVQVTCCVAAGKKNKASCEA